MGTPGVPFDVPKETIVHALNKNRGVLRYACMDLDCSYHTLYRAVQKEPELIELLKALRHGLIEDRLDESEAVLEYALHNKSNDLSSALKAAMYKLNNLGRKRGYTPPSAYQVEIDPDKAKLMASMFDSVAAAGREACKKVVERAQAQDAIVVTQSAGSDTKE
jgi:hypothetical protein